MRAQAARRGWFPLLHRLRSGASVVHACRSVSSATNASPLGDGRLKFQTLNPPSFWSRLKQQKEGLACMALSASVGFLALSIIRVEKQLEEAKEAAEQLKRQNQILQERLDGVKSILVEEEIQKDRDVVGLLREMLGLNGEGLVAEKVLPNSTENTEDSLQSSPRSKFMV